MGKGAIAVPTLHVLQGPDKGRTYEAPNETIVIGRSSESVHLSDSSSSRRHAEIRPSNGHWVLTDLKSSNGTYLNGQRVLQPAKLKHGDQIKIGATLLVFHGLEDVETFPHGQRLSELLEAASRDSAGESSILSSMDSSEESVILQAPETADAVAAWNVIFRVAETFGSSESVESFLERVVDLLFGHVTVDRLILLLVDADTGKLRPQLVRSRSRHRDRDSKFIAPQRIIDHVRETREGVLCANALTDTRFGDNGAQDSAHRLGLRSIICVPIIARKQLHGVLHLDCSMSRHTYSQEQLRLVVAIGRLMGMAIENFRLQESRVKTERLAAAGETVAYLSHYIRNILQGMQGGADVVELGLKRGNVEALQSGWGLVRANLDRIFLLTMNMLTFSKDRQPRIETAQLNAVLEDVLSLARGRADEKGVALDAELEDIPAIPIDPEGIHQVVHNIILNAIEAVADGSGRVVVRTHFEPEAGTVSLTIADNGPGIALEDRDRVFDAFHSSKGHGGTGLGLAAAKKIIDELHGTIAIENGGESGTTFRVTLPASHIKLEDSDKTLGGT